MRTYRSRSFESYFANLPCQTTSSSVSNWQQGGRAGAGAMHMYFKFKVPFYSVNRDDDGMPAGRPDSCGGVKTLIFFFSLFFLFSFSVSIDINEVLALKPFRHD